MRTYLACAALALVSACASQTPAPVEPHMVLGRWSGDGTACDRAVVIEAKGEFEGALAEHGWVKQHYPGHRVLAQSLSHCDTRRVDILEIDEGEGKSKKLYFDIDAFFGKR